MGGCFVIKNGRTTFKQGTRAEVLEKQKKSSGATMYVLADESAAAAERKLRCVEGEGLPLMRDPYQFGNLFLQLEIEFPTELSQEAVTTLQGVLEPPLNSSSADEEAEEVDTKLVLVFLVCAVSDRTNCSDARTSALFPTFR